MFQRHIHAVFRQLISDGIVLICLDDLIMPAKSEEENLTKLRKVLVTAMDYGLEINWKKCKLLVKIEYLDYVIEVGQVQPSNRKVQAIMKFPRPTTKKELQSFLGLVNYFRKFIPRFASMARPLSQLTKGDVKYEFEPNQEMAFALLKRTLVGKPVLRLYRVGAETELHTDACQGGLGAILMQKDLEDSFHPVYYASWKATPTEERYTNYLS